MPPVRSSKPATADRARTIIARRQPYIIESAVNEPVRHSKPTAADRARTIVARSKPYITGSGVNTWGNTWINFKWCYPLAYAYHNADGSKYYRFRDGSDMYYYTNGDERFFPAGLLEPPDEVKVEVGEPEQVTVKLESDELEQNIMKLEPAEPILSVKDEPQEELVLIKQELVED